MAGHPSAPVPDRPELSPGAFEAAPRWPWWFALVAFPVAVVLLGVLIGIAGAVAGVEPGEKPSTTLVIITTLVQSIVFAGVAVLFAAFVSRPKLWHFGLRRTPLLAAVGWAGLGLVSFYVFGAIYAGLVGPEIEQTVTEDLGADKGTAGLIIAGCVVMIVAPLGEEFFFRGFFYRALRSRFSVAVAAVIDGLVFGLLHYNFDGLEGLLLVPPLAFLGLVFCLVYEKTGSLWPVVAMHAFNNAVAYAVQADGGWQVSVVVGPLMIGMTMLLPRLLPPGPRGSRPLPVADPHPAGVG